MNLKIAVEVCNAWCQDNSEPKIAKRELFKALATLIDIIKQMEELDIQYSDQERLFRFKFEEQIPYSPGASLVVEKFNLVDNYLRSFYNVLEQLLSLIPRATVANTMLSQGWSQREKYYLLMEISNIMMVNKIYSNMVDTTTELLLEANLGVLQLVVCY